MNIGLIPMSAKPYHAGHHKLIQIAAKENDRIFVFVSLTGRGVKKVKDPTDGRTIKNGARKIEVVKKGETPIFGSDMQFIWENVLLNFLITDPHLKEKITIFLIRPDIKFSPINLVHEACERFKLAIDTNQSLFKIRGSHQSFAVDDTNLKIYSDNTDIVSNFTDKTMIPLYGALLNDRINRIGISRSDTVQVSGTKMRELIKLSEIKEFKRLLPPMREDQKNIIARILFESAQSGKSFTARSRENRVDFSLRVPWIQLG
ncbi:hypothetical protein OAA09_00555 [bacterium]|nr:hypothetical protein [bacterium]